jgi:hypothetical protein
MVTRKIQQNFIFSHQYINRLILFIIYGNISTIADNWQIIKFLRGALFSQVCPKCFSAKINLDHSRGAFGTLK